MTRRSRLAAATTAAVLACASLLVGAVSAPAAGPPIESYQSGGQARGLDVAFTFSGSIFERLLDLGLPHARSNVISEGGGASRGAAAQLFPGDLVVGALGESFPGYRQAVFPAEQETDAPDDAHFSETFKVPGMVGGGPVSVDNAHIVTTATADAASARVTTNLTSLGSGTPLITARSLETTSRSVRAVDHVDHVATTVVRDIEIRISEELAVTVGQLISEAHTRSDGASPVAETSLKISGVEVVMGEMRYEAAIDQDGIRIVGAPTLPLPSPLPANPIPGVVPQDVNQFLTLALQGANVKIAAGEGTKIVEDVSSDASLSGLLVTFTGIVPAVFVPDSVAELIYGEIVPQLPEALQDELNDSICYQENIRPTLERLAKPLADAFGDIPVCVSPAIVPGPGSGVVTTFSIGSVRSSSAAVQAVSFTDPGAAGGGDFPTFPPIDPGFGGSIPGGFPETPVGPGGAGQPNAAPPAVLTGLVARLPSAALLGAGAAFLALAMGLAMGPSLRGWRATRES